MKGAVRYGSMITDGIMSVRNDGVVGLKKHVRPTALRLKVPEADGIHSDNIRMC